MSGGGAGLHEIILTVRIFITSNDICTDFSNGSRRRIHQARCLLYLNEIYNMN